MRSHQTKKAERAKKFNTEKKENKTIMKNKILGMVFGMIAGVLDVIPMVIQKLTWDANVSAFSMWVIIGIIISSINFKLNSILKGIVISFMVLLPSAILIGWKEPISILPIAIMTLILGGGLGFFIDKFKFKE